MPSRSRAWTGPRVTRWNRYILYRDYRPDLGYTPCYHCGNIATTTDHYPLARILGGTDTPDNMVSSCGPCNYSSGAKLGNKLRNKTKGPSRKW